MYNVYSHTEKYYLVMCIVKLIPIIILLSYYLFIVSTYRLIFGPRTIYFCHEVFRWGLHEDSFREFRTPSHW